MMYQRIFTAPIGSLLLQATDKGLTAVHIRDTDGVIAENSNDILDQCCIQLAEYFAGSRMQFDIPLAPEGSSFQQQVWQLITTIPFGSTVSYQALSQTYGDLKAIRAIAAANGKNKIAIIVPCHRVIGSKGELTGFAWGLERKRWLLEHEARLSGKAHQPSLF